MLTRLAVQVMGKSLNLNAVQSTLSVWSKVGAKDAEADAMKLYGILSTSNVAPESICIHP